MGTDSEEELKNATRDSIIPDLDEMILPELGDNDTARSGGAAYWSTAEVVAWLKSVHLEMYVEAFEENNIDGLTLLNDITVENLVEDLNVKRIHVFKYQRTTRTYRPSYARKTSSCPTKTRRLRDWQRRISS